MQNKSAAPVPPAMNDTTDESLTLLELQSHQNNVVSELHRAMSSPFSRELLESRGNTPLGA